MKLVSGIVDSGFFAQSALSAEVATKDSLGRNISETYLTGVDLTPYQTVEGMTAYQSAGEYYSASNPSGFLVADDITGKLDASVYAADSASFLTAVPAGTMNESAFGYDANDKISGYNGSAFAGGSEVPEGVMVESGLEYNAVNEISGYNGSAIAQYGAEKQWLVHDDTLVHASNSAQYALGCNISALQRLMGIDETVLYSGDGTLTTAFTISEPLSGFERLRIYAHAASDGEIFEHIEEQSPPTGNYISYTHNYTIPNAYICQCFLGYLANGLTFSNIVTRRNFWNPTDATIYVVTSTDNQNLSANGWIYKIVGIGRKS
jgi:hypothetical protein